MKILLTCLTLLLGSVPPTRCQEVAPPRPVPVGGLVLEFIPYSDQVPVEAVWPVLDLFRRDLAAQQPDGQVNEITNISAGDHGVLVMDTAANVQAIKAALDRLAAGNSPSREPATQLQLETYVPRFVEASRLHELLKPLRRTVFDAPAPSTGQREGRSNVTCQESPSLLVLLDSPEQVARMRALLAQVDRPAPQMLLTCWLVGPDETGPEPQVGLPGDLVENLQRLLPWNQPRAVATAMLRMSVVAGDERKLEGRFSSFGEVQRFELVFKPAGVDESGRQLALQRIQFECTTGQGFDTSAVLTVGEYTVLGVAGDRPLLVALRATPLER